MKKANLALISSIFLFILINVSLAQAGCVTIKVIYNDGCPRSNADIRTIKAPNDPQVRYICTTGEDGQCSRCNYLEPGNYKSQSWYGGSQFGPDTFLGVDGNGDGSQTIKNTGLAYSNGTESCGSGNCNNYKYCFNGSSPAYVQCGSWQTDCDTCCKCNGGTQWNPSRNYDSSQNGDCPFCQKCSALDICGYQTSIEDLKNECPAAACDGNSCDGAGNCQDTTDETGYMCANDCFDCISGTCTSMTENNDGSCSDDCNTCVSGTCTNRVVCDSAECSSEKYCNVVGGDCKGFEEDSNVCNNCHAPIYHWTGNGGNLNCCGNNPFEDNPFQAIELSCSDGNDNDCDGLTDCADPDCVGMTGPGGQTCCQTTTDCGFCQKCSSNVCVNQTSNEDLKDQCDSGLCASGYCNGAGACDLKPDTTDCGTCALCNGLGNCNVYDPTQNSDCNPFDIATCFNVPDALDFTWDFRDSYCTGLNTCYQGTITHTCDQTCGAECDGSEDCQNKCVGNVRYYSGSCLSTCDCSWTTENCDSKDGWYNTINTQWISSGECTEKEQKQQEYRDYTCNAAACTYSVTGTQWIDTGNTRNKSNGTSCNDGLYCTVSDTCTSGVCGGSSRDCSDGKECTSDVCNEATDQCQNPNKPSGTWCGLARDCPNNACIGYFAYFYPVDGHDTCNSAGTCMAYSCASTNHYCTDNDHLDGVDTLECGAQCDQNSDCPTGICTSSCTCASDSTPPTINILSPLNTTYKSGTIQLTFTLSEPATWCVYSLDGSANKTIWSCNNMTLFSITPAPHNIVVYAKDASGNAGVSNKVYFTANYSFGGGGSGCGFRSCLMM